MEKRSDFFLEKWYLDCVSDQGDVIVGYSAYLRWKGFRQGYSSILYKQRDHKSETRRSLRYLPPDLQNGQIHWSAKKLAVNGTWSSLAPPIEQVLLKSSSGAIEWSCLMPSARVKLQLGAGRELQGLGYVERLTLSVLPWQLDFDELRWGRFLSSDDTLIWIDWRGSQPQQLVFYNGTRQKEARITDQDLAFGNTVLTLNDKQILRAGPLVNTVLAALPKLAQVVPLRILKTDECKWLSRACLKDDGEVNGWAIHELVRFTPSPPGE